ncbi:MAG: cell division protein FtsZ [Acetomicrobium flavidum]|uniref:Cell division protein FtsZ n=1 Tax=Acetomicrobium flavidum TaxID=49896 RepID=A0ABY1JAY0_9BACT|nr:cell division protein FtsZ [Acetomicrobium flavidum]SIN62770.1 cell division protein FtsZ [Acetomicrobium flavidum]
MAENGKLFEIDNSKEGKYREVIKVVGVGGGGNNALNHIISSGLKGVEFIAANTDVAQLNQNLASIKIVLGEQLTKGKGAGSDPEIGFKAAKESADMIKEILQGADMVFITAGMGGGTGTGASPVIAEVAKETGALVVAVVTKPFIFEGKVRIKQALEGIKNLQDKVDALIVIPNDKLLEISDKKMALLDSFKLADEVLRQAVQGVTDLILRPGLINVDFADVRAVMSNAGSAIMGIGEASGEDRAVMAAKAAINSPLMETPMQGAKGILFNVTGGNNVGIHEIKEAAQVITEAAAEDAIIIWGHVLDPEMDDKLQITVIATGFSPISQQSETSRVKSMSGKKRSRVDLEEAEVKVPEEDLFRISGVQVDTFDLPTVVRRKKKE